MMPTNEPMLTCETCLYCGARESRDFKAREMMFGFREEFNYRECLGCGCLQLLDVPSDLARYYPPHYGSFQDREAPVEAPEAAWKRWLRACRDSGQVLRKPALGRLLARLPPAPGYNDLIAYFRHVARASFDLRILD